MDIYQLGWNKFFEDNFAALEGHENFRPARVSRQYRNLYHVFGADGEYPAEASGKFLFQVQGMDDSPTVGDWVAVIYIESEKKGIIQHLLPRRSYFARKAVLAGGPKYGDGRIERQGLAANIDTVFLVTGLDNNFNIRRIERYVTVAHDSGAAPVIVLNKADLRGDLDTVITEVEKAACGLPVLAISAAQNQALGLLQQYLRAGQTVAFLGSSGVGKSTIINRLLGEDRLTIGDVRSEDNRGRHTTTHRELILLPDGGMVIDTPGLREIQAWGDNNDLSHTFEDIYAIAAQCRFSDCRHNGEPGCAIASALNDGTLDPGRYKNYLKLRREIKHLDICKNVKERRKSEREFDKKIAQYHRQVKEMRKKGLL
jgi:ribosome biogenesis GTPase